MVAHYSLVFASLAVFAKKNISVHPKGRRGSPLVFRRGSKQLWLWRRFPTPASSRVCSWAFQGWIHPWRSSGCRSRTPVSSWAWGWKRTWMSRGWLAIRLSRGRSGTIPRVFCTRNRDPASLPWTLAISASIPRPLLGVHSQWIQNDMSTRYVVQYSSSSCKWNSKSTAIKAYLI